jgi:hypothetical protein
LSSLNLVGDGDGDAINTKTPSVRVLSHKTRVRAGHEPGRGGRSRRARSLETGHGSSDAPLEGVAAVLLKPAASGELVRTIRSVLDRRRVVPVA